MRRLKKLLIALAILFATFNLVGFFALPPILKSILTKALSENLNREVAIERIKTNPYNLTASGYGVKINERGSPETFIGCEEIFVNLHSLSALKFELILEEIRVLKPYFRLQRKVDGTYNFSDLLEKRKAETKAKEKPLYFSLNNIQVQEGSIDLFDEGPNKKHTVRELKLGMASIANIPQRVEIFVQPVLAGKFNGTPYVISGKTKPFADSLETILDIDFQDLNLPYYLAYIPFKLNFRIPSAYLDAKAKLTILRSKEQPMAVTLQGDLTLKKLAVDDGEGKPVVRVPRLDVAIASLKPLDRAAHLTKVVLHSPELEIRRQTDGAINLLSLLPETSEKKKEDTKAGPESPFTIDIDEAGLSAGKVVFSDFSLKQPFKTTLSPVEVRISHFSNSPDKKTEVAVSLATEAKETVKAEGNLSIQPLQGEGNFEIKGIPLRKYSPYYEERILFDIADGRVDFASRYEYAVRGKETPVLLKDLSLSLQSLRLRQKKEKEDFLKIPLLNVRDTQLNLSQRELTVGSVTGEKGNLELTRLQDGTLDLMALVPAVPKGPEEKTAPEQPWVATLGKLALEQFAVRVRDQALAAPVSHTVEKIRVTGENISTGKGQKGKLSLSLLLNQRTDVSARSTFSIDPLQVDGLLEVKRLPLRPYAPYYQDRILFEVEGGEAEVQTEYRFSKGGAGAEIRLAELSSSVAGLKLQKKGEPEPFLEIPAASVKGASLDLNRKEISVREVATEKGAVQVRRSKKGEINLLTLLPAPQKDPAPGRENPPKDEQPWAVKVKAVSLSGYQVKVEDREPPETVRMLIEDLEVKGEDLSTARDQKGQASVSFRLNQQGKISLGGSFGINPASADLKVALDRIPIGPFQPYFSDRVKITVTDGRVAANGNLGLRISEGAGLQATYKGDGSIRRFTSLDKVRAEDLLKWESLSITGMDVGYNPLFVRIDGIALANFYSRLAILPDGTLNVQDILGKGEQPEKPPAASAKKESSPEKPPGAAGDGRSLDMKIKLITLQGGEVDFSDDYIKPNYSANLTEVGGRVSDLNAQEMKSGNVELRGVWNKIAPIEIKGLVNPVAKDLYVDLQVRLQDIELSPISPYAGKYIGYSIQKGKLGMDLKYLIVQKKLEAENKIFFNQLTLGEKIESPQATKLPVRLAISLLKDRKGEINLDIPVSGSLDDPKFSVFGIILKVIGNLIAKAATSPFALIGAMMGGGEQLDYAEFDFGSAEVKGEAANKLKALGKGLQDRPEIKMDIEGHVDPEKDREALKTLFFQRKIKAQKAKETAKKGQAAVPVDEVKVDAAEYPRYLKRAYREEKFPKPQNILGLRKDIPVPEMEKLILTHIEVKEGDLRTLAFQRAQKAKDFLVQEGKIDPARIFLAEPKSLAPEKKEKIKESRVDFRLKS